MLYEDQSRSLIDNEDAAAVWAVCGRHGYTRTGGLRNAVNQFSAYAARIPETPVPVQRKSTEVG